MAPIRYTIESFEDVAGCPDKIFYVIHPYPGTGCRQVPFLAIDKTEDGFEVRELEQHPVEEFIDAKYKFQWPRDPRLQNPSYEPEELVSSEPSPSTSDEPEELVSSEPFPSTSDSSSMPVMQNYRSVSMDFYRENTISKAVTGTKEVKIEEGVEVNKETPSVLTLPLSSRIIKESSACDKPISFLTNIVPSTSKTSLAFDSSVATTRDEEKQVSDESNGSFNKKYQNPSTSKNPDLFNDSAVSDMRGSGVSLDTDVSIGAKVEERNTVIKALNQNATISKVLLPASLDDNTLVALRTAESTVSLSKRVDDASNQFAKTLSHNTSSSTSLISDLHKDGVGSTGSSVSLCLVDDETNQSAKTINKRTSTSKSIPSDLPNDSVTSKKVESTSVVDTTENYVPSEVKALNPNVLTASPKDCVIPERAGSSTLQSEKVGDVPNRSARTATQNASLSISATPSSFDDCVASKSGMQEPVFISKKDDNVSAQFAKIVEQNVSTSKIVSQVISKDSQRSKNTQTVPMDKTTNVSIKQITLNAKLQSPSSVVPGMRDKETEPMGSLPSPLSCPTDSLVEFHDSVNKSPSVSSAVEFGKLTSKVATESDHPPVTDKETCKKNSEKNVVRNFESKEVPIDSKESESISSISDATHTKMNDSPIKSGLTKATMEKVISVDKVEVVRQISCLVNAILSKQVKCNNQSHELDSNLNVPDVFKSSQTTPEANKLKKDDSSVELVKTSEEITSRSTFAHSKLNDQIHETSLPKMSEVNNTEESIPHEKSLSPSTSDCGSVMGSSEGNLQVRSSVCKDYTRKGRESLDKNDKDPADLKEKVIISNRGKEMSCLPKVAEKELRDIDSLITKAKNFVTQKRIAYLENKPLEDWLARKEKFTKESCTEPSRPELKHNLSSGIETQSQSNNSASDASERSVKIKINCGTVKGTSDAHNVRNDGEIVFTNRKAILNRRITVDGSEDRFKGRRKSLSSKYSVYNLQQYRKDLEKHRPTKKIPKTPGILKTDEKHSDDGGSAKAGSLSCPGSPVSKIMKSSIEDIVNLEAILTDDSSACNYSDITLKGPIHVASNASLDKSEGSLSGTIDNQKPTLKDKAIRKSTDEQHFVLMRKKIMADKLSKSGENSKEFDKNPDQALQEGSLTNYAESALSKSPQHDQNSKKQERKNKCLAFTKELNSASETSNIGIVDKGESSARTELGTPKVNDQSKPPSLAVGLHKLPAMVSSRGSQLKPKPVKKLVKNGSGHTTNKLEIKRGEEDITSTEPLKKVGDVKDLLKPSDVKSNDKIQDELVGDKKADCSPSRISLFFETSKLKFSLKRQNKIDSSPYAPSVNDPPRTKVSKTKSSLEVSAPSGTSLNVSPSSNHPTAKHDGDKLKKDTPKNTDVSKCPDEKKHKADSPVQTEIKTQSKPHKNSSKLDDSEKSSVISTMKHGHEDSMKRSPILGHDNEEVPSALDVSDSQANKILVDDTLTPSMKAVVDSCVDKKSACLENSTAVGGTITGSLTVSNSSSNSLPVSSKCLSDPTDLHPITESRKKLLRELTTSISSEKKLLLSLHGLSKKPHPQEKLLGSVSIGTNDLIEDKIKSMVENIVKVKIELNENEKNTSQMDPLTPEDASPVNGRERGESASELNDVIVIPDDLSDSIIPQPKVSEPATGKSGNKDVVPENLSLEDVGTHQNSIDESKNQPNLNAKKPSLNESSIVTDKLVSTNDCVISTCSTSEKSQGSSSLTSNSMTPEETAEVDDKNENQKVLTTEDLSSQCDGPAPDVQKTPVEISSEESDVEMTEDDDISCTARKSGMMREKKKRRRVDEHVPTIAALTRSRRMRRNRLAELRKLVARRFSIEPFSPSKFFRAKRNINYKRASKKFVVNKAPCPEATEVELDASNTEVEKSKSKVITPAVESTKPEVISATVETAKSKGTKSIDGVMNSEVVKPNAQLSIPNITKPDVGDSKTEVIKPVVEVKNRNITKPVLEVTECATVETIVLVTEHDEPNHPGDIKVIESVVNKPPVVVESTKSATPVGVVTESANNESLTEVIEIEEEINTGRVSIPFLEDEDYPPKSDGFASIASDSVPRPLFMPMPIEMPKPKPLLTPINRSRDGSDNIIEITDSTSTSGNGRRSSSKRLNSGESGQSTQKRICAIPAPKLLPVTPTPTPGASNDATPQLVEPVMPQPMIEFCSSPSRVVTPAEQEQQGPAIGPSNSSTSKRETSLSKELKEASSSSSQYSYGIKTHGGEQTAKSLARRGIHQKGKGKSIIPEGTSKTAQLHLRVWKKDVRPKKALLDISQSLVKVEHSQPTSLRISLKGRARGSRSSATRHGVSPSKRSESQLRVKILNKKGCHCSPPLLSESGVSIDQRASPVVARCKKPGNPSSKGGVDHCPETTPNPTSTSNPHSILEHWERPSTKKIFKVDREESAWRNQLEDGRRFLGRRLKRFSHQDLSTTARAPSSPSTPETRKTGESKGKEFRPSSTASLDGQSSMSSVKKLRSSSHHMKELSDEPARAPLRKERPSSRGKGFGPGHRKGERRKIEGGPSRQLRSTAHKSRSGLIRKGDT